MFVFHTLPVNLYENNTWVDEKYTPKLSWLSADGTQTGVWVPGGSLERSLELSF